MVKEAQAKYLSTDIEEQIALEKEACPDGYKLTEIGMIPDDWEVKGFKEISFMKGRIGWQGLKQSEFTMNSDEPFLITGMNFKDGDIRWDEVYHVSEERYQVAKEIQLKVDDILMTKDGTIGKLLYVKYIPHPNKATLNSHLLVFRPINRSYVPLYLYYNLSSPFFIGHIELHKSGTTFFGISQESVSKYNVLLPPIREQTAIANALSDVDVLISSLEKLIAKKQAIKTATMQQLLTGKKRLPGFGEGKGYKQTELGEIPEDWEVFRFDDIADLKNERVNPQITGGGEYCIELEHIDQGRGRINGNTITTGGSSIKNVFKEGNVLFGKLRAYLKKYWYANSKGVCSTEIWVLQAKRAKVLSLFLYQVVQTEAFIDCATEAYGTHMPRADWKVVGGFLVNVPSIEEQNVIASALSNMDKEIEIIEDRVAKTQKIKQGMMQELLTGKTRLVNVRAL